MKTVWIGIILLLTVCLCITGCAPPAEQTPQPAVSSTTEAAVTTTATTNTTAAVTTTTQPQPNSSAAGAAVVLDPTYECLLLVNAEHPLPADFKVGALVTVPSKHCNGSYRQVSKDIYPYVMAMIQAAAKDGVTLYVRSPYRPYSTQKALFRNELNYILSKGVPASEAEAVAAKTVARPGTSEHQTGLAIDFNVASNAFKNTPAHLWLVEHAAEYGFIMRYPENKTDITGVIYEPWHWRFVGVDTAREIGLLGLTLEEYVALQTAPM